MTTIPDVQLCAHSKRLEGKVVLITGEKDVPQRPLPRHLIPFVAT